MTPQNNIRNFCIIAHIDHGKSTLADRIIQKCGALSEREMKDQILDSMDLERERGITIKAQSARLIYESADKQKYTLNLIDTPGHVDFSYEVSRSLAACEGALLVVDASQGVQAQTLSNVYQAAEAELFIVPVINKIDLPSASPEAVIAQIEDIVGIAAKDAPLISAKNDINIGEVLERIITDVPAPAGDETAPLKAIVFDSLYDAYKGVIVYLRVIDGAVKKGDRVLFMASGKDFEVVETGYFAPSKFVPCEILRSGEVGFITASIKNVKDTRVGDTVTGFLNRTAQPFPGYKKVNPMVYCGVYPADGAHYEDLRDALNKLCLNDASVLFENENSVALGFGFRCGFLGLLHLEIIIERLSREYDLDIVTTAPGVIYKVFLNNGQTLELTNPNDMPDSSAIAKIEEPFVCAEIILPAEYIGRVMDLCNARRGEYLSIEYLEQTKTRIKYNLPLNEIIYDFFDALKSVTRGYASFDYEFYEYRQSDLVKLDILINRESVDALSLITHRTNANDKARKIAEKLKKEIPRHLFEIPIQASIGSKIIARETISALRKDVLAKCYGGDITRKKKLLEKQKEGKKRLRQVGQVQIPQAAFTGVLKLTDN